MIGGFLLTNILSPPSPTIFLNPRKVVTKTEIKKIPGTPLKLHIEKITNVPIPGYVDRFDVYYKNGEVYVKAVKEDSLQYTYGCVVPLDEQLLKKYKNLSVGFPACLIGYGISKGCYRKFKLQKGKLLIFGEEDYPWRIRILAWLEE